MTNSVVPSGKISQRDAITYVLANTTLPNDIKEKFEAMLQTITNRNVNGVRKPTARQTENEGIKTAILNSMTAGVEYTIGEMLKQFACFDDTFTSQRVSALLSQLKDDGKVIRTEVKGKAYFRLP